MSTHAFECKNCGWASAGSTRSGFPLRYCRRCGWDSWEACPDCGARDACPAQWGHDYIARPEDVGLAADWRPPLKRAYGDRGWRMLDEDTLRRQLPAGVAWITVGSRASDRFAAHGIKSWWVSQCTYLVLVRRHEAAEGRER